jgi:hypothetical protein
LELVLKVGELFLLGLLGLLGLLRQRAEAEKKPVLPLLRQKINFYDKKGGLEPPFLILDILNCRKKYKYEDVVLNCDARLYSYQYPGE